MDAMAGFESFRLMMLLAAASASAAAASGIAWVRFVDPAEHAFSMDVPQGWKITGGTYRFGPLDPRAMVDMISPDSAIRLRFGDSGVPPFAVPDRNMLSLGFREGSRYSPRGVAQERIANYRPGWVFADLYGQARFSALCRSLELKQMRQLSPVHENQGQEITAGEVVYRCESSSGPLAGYVFAETQLTRMQTTAIWQVTALYSFLARDDQAANALKTILHAMATFQIDPQWEMYQLRLNGQAAQAAYRGFQQSMAQEHEHFTRQEARFQQQVDGFSRALRGVTLTNDPVGNVKREVWTGPSANYFINPAGVTVNAPTSPGPGFHQLQPRN